MKKAAKVLEVKVNLDEIDQAWQVVADLAASEQQFSTIQKVILTQDANTTLRRCLYEDGTASSK